MLSTLLGLAVCLSPAQEIDRSTLAAVVEPYLTAQGVPGAVVALVVDGKPSTLEAFGLSNLAAKTPMEPGARFQVGSVTKPVTAALVARLVDEGLLSYDDAISTRMPEGVVLPERVAEITIRELLTHSSGLPREPINRVDLPDSPSVMVPMSSAELCEGLGKTELEHARGERWSYSNLGYGLLGVIAAQAGGERYEVLLEKRVLRPLGMTHSAVYVGKPRPAGLATCYWPEDAEPIERDPWVFGGACAFSGLVTDARDLSLFLAAQMDTGEAGLFSSSSLAFLHEPVVSIDAQRGRAMAPGRFVDPMPGGLVAIGHGGEIDGHSAVIAFFPALRAGIVVLCNKGGKSAENLAYAMMGQVLPRLMGQ